MFSCELVLIFQELDLEPNLRLHLYVELELEVLDKSKELVLYNWK